MNKHIIEGNWKQITGKLKQQWGKFTDDDIKEMDGTYEALQGKLEEIYGYERDKAEKEIENFCQRNNLH
jgi:uncharacterized protein YjbJ (UPF0337 family)